MKAGRIWNVFVRRSSDERVRRFRHSKGCQERLVCGCFAYRKAGGREDAAPYLQFGDVSSRDWSTTSDAGAEHVLHLHVWSMQQGLKEALEIAADAQRILDDSALTLGGHRLVSIQYVSTESRREQSGRFARISLRFRAVTEPI